MTKEEILKPHYKQNNNGLDEWVDYEVALNSMDFFAEQECIGFTEWAFGDDINPFIFVKGKWMQANGNSASWSTKQLYQLYLKSKQQP